MAGVIKVDRVQSDSNLAFNIAGANVAFMDASALRLVGSSIVANGSTIVSGSKVSAAGMPTGSVLQTVQVSKTDTWTSSSDTWTNITGLTATITPSSTSSKILVMSSVLVGLNYEYFAFLRLARNGSVVLQGDAAGSRKQIHGMAYMYNQASPSNAFITWPGQAVDSPGTTSSLTYSVQMRIADSRTTYVNRLQRDDNADYEPRGASTLILMEIAG